MKRIILIFINLLLCIRISAQSEPCSIVTNELAKQKDIRCGQGLMIHELDSLAQEYYRCNKYNEATPLIEQIIDNWPESRPKEDVFFYYQVLGNIYLAIGRADDAEKLYLSALSELKKNNNLQHETYRNICDALGNLYYQVHNYQKAKEFSGISKWLHEKYMDFDNSYIRCLSNCALTESQLGHNYIAKLLIDVALKCFREGYDSDTTNMFVIPMQNSVYTQLLSNAAMIYQQAGFWDDAVICLKECISISEKLGEQNAAAYNNLGTMYLLQSKSKESLPYFSKAVSLCKTEYVKIELLFNYALALWMSDSEYCSKIAIQTSELLKNSIYDNFSFLSQEEKFNYFKHFEFYLPLLNYIIYEGGNENQYGSVYDNILTTKGLLLKTSNDIKETILKSGDEELIGAYNRMITLRQQLIKEQDSAFRLNISKEIEVLDKNLSRSAAGYGLFKKTNSTSWRDVREKLESDAIAIEFYNMPTIQQDDTIHGIENETRYCAIIIKNGWQNPKIVPLCRENELNELDEDSLYCTDMLYRLVWEPLESELKGVRNVYFSADRELHKIGIEYALMRNNNRINQKYNLYRLSSTRLLVENNKKTNHRNAVLYGGLIYNLSPEQLIEESRNGEYHSEKTSRAADLYDFRYGVKYLPGTKEEVENIHKSFLSNKSTGCVIITDVAGTEESFKSLASKDIGIIHLATHGFYWSEDEAEKRSYVNFLSNTNEYTQSFEDRALLRSGLFFSGANIGLAGENLPDDVEDGVLTAQELSVMNLGNLDMVVMSACQSGLGEISGEGVFGLQRGFKLAGANTLLMSLWKVDDEATKILMTEFYKNYLSGKTKRESLYLAQQTLRTTHPEAEYWAAFVLLDGLD